MTFFLPMKNKKWIQISIKPNPALSQLGRYPKTKVAQNSLKHILVLILMKFSKLEKASKWPPTNHPGERTDTIVTS